MQQDTFIGKQIGDFIVQERLNQGSRSIVYRAFQQSTSRDVALKLIRIDRRLGRDPAFQQRFTDAAERVRALSHKHLTILPIYAYGVEDEVAYIAMRLTSGRTLETYLKAHPIPNLAATARLVTQLGRGLSFAHMNDIIHYNLKPASILMDETGNLFLTDFGLARHVLDEDANSTKQSNLQRLSLYLAPEQLRGESLTPQANVFSLGVVMYRMTTGRLPLSLHDGNPTAVIQRHLNEPPQPPRSLNSDIQPALEDIILRAMQKEPSARFSDVETMMQAMNDVLSTMFERAEDAPTTVIADDTTSTTTPPIQPDAAPKRTGPLVAVSLVITSIIVMVGLGALLIYAPVPISVILEDQTTPADQIVPNQREITNARRQLGDTGFIAYTACNTLNAADAARTARIEALADQYNLPLQVYNSGGSPLGEIRTLQQARTDGASAIIHCVIGSSTIGRALTSIDDIPLIVDSTLPDDTIEDVVFVVDNEYALGEASGRAAGAYIQEAHDGEAAVLLLDDAPVSTLSARAQGLHAGILAVAPEANLLGVYPGGDTEIAEATLRDLIGDEVEFDVILTVTNNSAYGVVNALEFAGYLPDEVALYSIGAELLAQRQIEQGVFLRGSSRIDNNTVSAAMLNAAIELLGGGAVTEYILPSAEVLTAGDPTDG